MHKLLKHNLNLLLALLNFTFMITYFMNNIKLPKINFRLLSKCFELKPFISYLISVVIQYY